MTLKSSGIVFSHHHQIAATPNYLEPLHKYQAMVAIDPSYV